MEDSKFKILGSVKAVQTRPGMFIGENSTADHLGQETLDNAFDELRNEFADEIHVFIDEDEFWISDNGRGLELGETLTENGDKIDKVVAACTILFSGTKFNFDDYESLFGQNGVGLVAVNALSDWLEIKVRDRNNKNIVYNYKFENAEFISKTEEVNNDQFSTIVGFKPNSNYFENVNFNVQLFKERLLLGKSNYPNKKFYLNNEEIENISIETFAKNKLDVVEDPIYNIKYVSSKTESINIYATYVESNQKLLSGDTNLRLCEGTYLYSFQTALINALSEKREFKRIKNPADLLMGLRVYISLKIPEPKFDSQTKIRMVADIKKTLITPIENHIKWFANLPHVVDMLTRNLEKKYGNKTAKKISKSTMSPDNKLRDCINSPGKILYLCEGDSADGTLKEIKDKYWEASLPFRGKVLNVENATIDQLYKNQEIRNLREALGEEGNRRYEKIKILCDADSVSAETIIWYIDKNGLIKFNEIQYIDELEIDKTISFNRKTQQSELKRVRQLIKHKYDKGYIYRITTVGGFSVDFTDDHAIFVYNTSTNTVELSNATSINTDIHRLLIPSSFPNIETGNNILDITDELINSLTPNHRAIIKIPVKKFKWDCDSARINLKNRISGITRKELISTLNIPIPTLAMYTKGIDNTGCPIKHILKINKHVNLKDSHVFMKLSDEYRDYIDSGEIDMFDVKIKNKIEITEDLAYIVGFYIGNGCFGSSKKNPYDVMFFSGHEEHILRLCRICDNCGFKKQVIEWKDNCYILHVKSLELTAILKTLGFSRKNRANTKFIPDMFLSLSNPIKIGLLSGMFNTDGTYFNTNRIRLGYSTVSKKLKDGLVILLRQLDVLPSIIKKSPSDGGINSKNQQIIGRSISYSININKYRDLIKLDKICRTFNNYKKPNIKTQQNTNLSDSVKLIKIKSVEKINYKYNYVYDIEVEDNHTFSSGITGVHIVNSDGAHIASLMILVLQKYAADMIKEGRVSVIIPPLYGATKKKEFIPIYDKNLIDNYKKNGYSITRYKGLGEMNPEQLEIAIKKEIEYVLEWPETDELLEGLIGIITNTELKRIVMNDPRTKLEKILKLVLEGKNS